MHSSHLSATETAIHFRLQTIVLKWKRIYYEKGPQSLYKEKLGKPRKMSAKKDTDLLEELQRLRIENEYKKIKCLSSGKNQAREQEKVIVVDKLRHKYSLRELLKLAEMPKSTFYYHLKQ